MTTTVLVGGMTMPVAPSLGRIVLVSTPIATNGQAECVGIVTRVVNAEQGQVDVTMLPPGSAPSPISSIYPGGHPYAGAHSWRWPERSAS